MAKPSPNVWDLANHWENTSGEFQARFERADVIVCRSEESVDAKEEPTLSDDNEQDALENELARVSLEGERLAKQRRKIAGEKSEKVKLKKLPKRNRELFVKQEKVINSFAESQFLRQTIENGERSEGNAISIAVQTMVQNTGSNC